MFDLTTYVKKWRIRQLKTVFSTLDTLWIDMRVFCDVGNIRKTMVAATSWGLRRRSSAGVIETVMRQLPRRW